jgi:very-short-patch-repair endonuclease
MSSKRININIDDLISRYTAGESAKELSTAFNVSVPWIRQRIKERNAFRPYDHKVLSKEQSETLTNRYEKGETTSQLGIAYGVSGRVVCDYLKRAGVRARPVSCGFAAWRKNSTFEERSEKSKNGSVVTYKNSTKEFRDNLTKAAHIAWTGCHHTETSKINGAISRAKKAESGSVNELVVAKQLTDCGIEFKHQTAIGPYNVDFTVKRTVNGHVLEDIVIEVTSGWARKAVHTQNWRKRFAQIIDAGFHLYIIWLDTRTGKPPVDINFTEDFISWLNILEHTPSLRRQYRVFWRSCKVIASGCADADEIAAVFSTYPKV